MSRAVYVLLVLLSMCGHTVLGQTKIKGRVTASDNGEVLTKALIKVNGKSTAGTTTDTDGNFTLFVSRFPAVIEVSHVGYQTVYYPLNQSTSAVIEIAMQESSTEINEVVVSTGYQQIPRERVTGSFALVNNEQFNRRVSGDILSRLEDQVPGLVFNRRNGQNNLSVRGRNTITGDGQPLIVVDNFPFEGDLSSLNPNDIENVTILKDAAASSIWGARAGNGVIVITTKKGGFLQKPRFTFNTNFTVSEDPDLYYQPQMSPSDYIDWEQQLFQTGYYTPFENSPLKVAFTPVVEVLFKKRMGLLSEGEADAAIAAFKQNDLRRDLRRFVYRKAQNQQYSLALSGGTAHQKYAVSLGFDKQLDASVGNDNRRITLNANHTYGLMNNKVEFSTGIFYASQQQNRNALGMPTYNGTQATHNLYPYARLTDDMGNPVAVVKNHRMNFVEQAAASGLYNWAYTPLSELEFSDKTTQSTETRLRAELSYKVLTGLKAEISYLYQNSSSALRDYYSTDTYYTRNLVNTYTQVNAQGGYSLPIPYGGILDRGDSRVSGNSVRGQVNYSRQISNGKLDAIAGSEIRDHRTESLNYRWYGYNDLYANSTPVDYTTAFRSFVNPLGVSLRIPANQGQTYLIDRYLSFYSNAAYSWKNRYVASASARVDQSNLFGVKANQRGVPLWSAGLGWVMSEEGFLKNRLPYLKLRLTYGSSGNVNKTLSALTTASLSTVDNFSTLPYATIQNPPNPSLQWEQVKMFNAGLDFALLRNKVDGSLEFFRKRGEHLFGQIPYAPSSGVSQFSGNTSATTGTGLDLNLNAKVLSGNLRWDIMTLFSYVKDKVSESKVTYPASLFLAAGEFVGYPIEGKPQYAMFSYKYAGLDGQNGDPLGYLDGEVSNDWSRIVSAASMDLLQYHGSARPVVFGAVRNNVTWKNLTLSANVSYRLGYYFRRTSVNYATLWTGRIAHGDYEKRWQNPGDELYTDVPSSRGGVNTPRNTFYANSSALVDRGDHIRLQDMRMNYSFKKISGSTGLDVYLYANNLGILWKATTTDLDPDYPVSLFPPARSLSVGLTLKI